MQKKRIHEVTYAKKVVGAIKINNDDNIKLNENLFHAQQVARHSTTFIKDIQKDVRSTLKKYDTYVKLSESKRYTTERAQSDSARHQLNNSQCKLKSYQSEKQLETLREQQQVLMNLLNNLQQQEKLILQQNIPTPEQYPNITDKQWYDKTTQKLKQIQEQAQNNENDQVIKIDLSKLKRSPNSKTSTGQYFFSSNSIRNGSEHQANNKIGKTYANLHKKQTDSPKKWYDYGLINAKKNSYQNLNVSKRNEMWKQKIDNKIQNELKKKREEEKQIYTFQPHLKKTPKSHKASKEYSSDLNEIMYLIDDLNDNKNLLKRSRIQK